MAYRPVVAPPPAGVPMLTYAQPPGGAGSSSSSSGGCSLTYRQTVIMDQPVGYWRLNEASGTAAANQMAAGTAGIYTGTLLTHSATGGAVVDGGYLGIDSTGTGQPGINTQLTADYTSAHTLECWLLPGASQADAKPLIGGKFQYFASGASDFPVAYMLSADNKPTIALSKGNDFTGDLTLVAPASLSTTDSSHLAFVYRANGLCEIYVNGSQVASTTIAFAISASSTLPWRFGSASEQTGGLNATAISGRLSECAIYNRALSGAQIAAHFAARNA